MTENKVEQTGVEFYPIEEMLKSASIESRATADVTYDVPAPVAASLDVGRHVYITLFRLALEQGRIKLEELPITSMLGVLHLLGEFIEENWRLRCLHGQVHGAVSELGLRVNTLEPARERVEDKIGDIAEQVDAVRTLIDDLYNTACEITETTDELKGLFDVGDGA